MLILLDQDGVLANFDLAFYQAWEKLDPGLPAVPPQQRHNFYVRDDYPKSWQSTVRAIYTAKNFYRDLVPIEGALEAAQEMLELGHDVRICTSPLNQYHHCVTEKFAWIEQHLGREWIGRMVLTKDKTLVRGDVLIDDNPKISGSLESTWQHLIFEQPYNRNVAGVRINWQNWREVLAGLDQSAS